MLRRYGCIYSVVFFFVYHFRKIKSICVIKHWLMHCSRRTNRFLSCYHRGIVENHSSPLLYYCVDTSVSLYSYYYMHSWWCQQIETFSAWLALCARNSPVTDEFFSQRTGMRSFNVFFDLRMKKRLCKHSGRRWFETPSCSLWCHDDVVSMGLFWFIRCRYVLVWIISDDFIANLIECARTLPHEHCSVSKHSLKIINYYIAPDPLRNIYR